MEVGDEGVVEEFEADRAESALLLLEDAVGAEATVDGSVGDCVEEERRGWGDVATVAWVRRGVKWIHRNGIEGGWRGVTVTLEMKSK